MDRFFYINLMQNVRKSKSCKHTTGTLVGYFTVKSKCFKEWMNGAMMCEKIHAFPSRSTGCYSFSWLVTVIKVFIVLKPSKNQVKCCTARAMS